MIEHASLLIYILLVMIASVAGFIDTLSGGGGGLITLPAMLFTGMNPVTALGTNKLQSAIGEFSATLHFFENRKLIIVL